MDEGEDFASWSDASCGPQAVCVGSELVNAGGDLYFPNGDLIELSSSSNYTVINGMNNLLSGEHQGRHEFSQNNTTERSIKKEVDETVEGHVNHFTEPSNGEDFDAQHHSANDSSDGETFDALHSEMPNITEEPGTSGSSNTRRTHTFHSRKRPINSDNWVDTAAKRARNTGTEGVSRDGKRFRARGLGPGCKSTCRFKCQRKVTLAQRQKILQQFLILGDRTRQWEFVSRYSPASEPEERKRNTVGETRKKVSHKYFLPVTVDKQVKVCRTMFTDTLGITRRPLQTITKKLSSESGFIGKDLRGCHTNRPKKNSEETRQSVHDHIRLFPTVESHYCRSDRKMKYLEAGLSISKMYGMYKAWCEENDIAKVAGEQTYRKMFNFEHNLSFFKPKKDRCDDCEKFAHIETGAAKEKARNEWYAEHQNNKEKARSLKANDIEEAKKNSSISVACFDLQKVLSLPKAETSCLYYKRKLSCYNFTIYKITSRYGICNFWNETIAKRGANEIASFVWRYISKEIEMHEVNDFRFWSDNCGGQNRNQILFSMYLKAAHDFEIKITHRFLEKGHTQNEGDSMHAAIERACQHKPVYTEDEWCGILKSARPSKPYEVNVITQEQILDFGDLAKSHQNWKKIRISEIQEIHFDGDAGNVKFKYNFDDETSNASIEKKEVVWTDFVLQRAYDEKIDLPKCKIEDLRFMCDRGLIPQNCRPFYDNIIS